MKTFIFIRSMNTGVFVKHNSTSSIRTGKKCGFLTFKFQTPNKTGMKAERWRDFAGVLSLFS